jgi:hypothetical protein
MSDKDTDPKNRELHKKVKKTEKEYFDNKFNKDGTKKPHRADKN